MLLVEGGCSQGMSPFKPLVTFTAAIMFHLFCIVKLQMNNIGLLMCSSCVNSLFILDYIEVDSGF